VDSVKVPGSAAPTPRPSAPLSPDQNDRIARLESTVAELQSEVAALRRKIDDLFG
jgi:uncharacterized protein YceH (UPF0502 family)